MVSENGQGQPQEAQRLEDRELGGLSPQSFQYLVSSGFRFLYVRGEVAPCESSTDAYPACLLNNSRQERVGEALGYGASLEAMKVRDSLGQHCHGHGNIDQEYPKRLFMRRVTSG